MSAMFRNHLKTAFRTLWKQKGFTFLNTAGLAIGVAACLLILQYVNFEWSYENFHKNGDNIYRVALEQYQSGEAAFKSAENYPGLAPALMAEVPEVKSVARMYNLGAKNNMVVTYEGAPTGPIKFKQKRLLYADSSFLPMFSFEMIGGDPKTALAEPLKMVITESYAKRYFGDEDPLGKMLHLQDDDFNDELCEVTGVVKDIPENSHLKFDILVSYSTLFGRFERAPERYDQSWRRKDMYTYVETVDGADAAAIEAKLPALIAKYNPQLKEQNREDIMRLQPLKDIHLYSQLSDEPEVNGDGRSVSFLLIIALFILVIAYVNYINLATSRSLERANEVGVRKVMGAMRGQLIRQFLIESALINLVALVLAMVIVAFSLPLFNQLTGMGADTSVFNLWQQPWFWLTLLSLFFAGAFLSGLYPAFVLSSFKPVSVLSGKFRAGRGGSLFRKALVVFQFATCVALIVGTFTVYRQLNFMRSQDLGFNPEQLLVVERPGVRIRDSNQRRIAIDGFKTQVKQDPNVLNVSSSVTIPGKKMRWKTIVRKYGDPVEDVHTVSVTGGDWDFVETLEMEIVAGRNFSRDMGTDLDTAGLISASVVPLLGFDSPEDAIGKTITLDQFQTDAIVVGVVKDYHQESLKEDADPTIFYPTEYGGEYYLAKVNTNNINQTISKIETAWETHFPGNPFNYFFLDDLFDQQYQSDQRFGQIFGLFALLAIIVGCLGLFGLAAFAAQKRVKEIGIRKVLGASVMNILVLLSKDFVKLVLLANVIALPIIILVMNKWLEGFANRIQLGWGMFLIAALVVLVIALITVSFQTLRAALANPVESIKYE